MPRPLRVQAPDALYHLTSRGNRRQRTFLGDDDYRLFVAMLERVVARFEWRCHSYCLMPNHYHLVVQTPVPNLSEGMQRLNGHYALQFNWLHGYDGHLFQGRFRSEPVESDRHLAEVSRYVVLNPVRARLVASPDDWRWSSYRATVARRPTSPLLSLEWLDQFGRDPALARERFAEFVADAPERPRGGVVLGAA